MCPLPANNIQPHLYVLFLFLIKVDYVRFCWKKSFQYLIFVLVNLSVLSHLGFTLDSIWWLCNALYDRTQFSARENYQCSLWTLTLQSETFGLSFTLMEMTLVRDLF